MSPLKMRTRLEKLWGRPGQDRPISIVSDHFPQKESVASSLWKDQILKKNLFWIVTGLVIVGIVGLYVVNENTPGKYDSFAKCLKSKRATFYGAFWCPHCQNQKTMFGKAAKYLPYFECSNPDGQSQNQA